MIILVAALVLLVFGSVAAQELTPVDIEDFEECLNGDITGTVVGIDLVDGSAVVTIYNPDNEDDPLCTVTIEEITADHPIVNLLGIYFGISVEDLTEALNISHVCLVEFEEEWYLVDCDDEFDIEGYVISYEDGTLTVLVDGEALEFELGENGVDEELLEALDTLTVDWELEDGKLIQTIEKIAEYHQEGIGFGVLVKLFAIAEANDDLTVEELIEEFLSGTGIGELFKEYGKPSLLGVGHVRQELKAEESNGDLPGMKKGKKFNQQQDEANIEDSISDQQDNHPGNSPENKPGNKPEKEDKSGSVKLSNENKNNNKDKSLQGVCNARASGGSAIANGKVINCP
ncbi:MAG: hypothetical protein IBX69_13165 [Anaerolineales bacterium]|nr:hypothetical protein [Anaerolineales bacterium]